MEWQGGHCLQSCLVEIIVYQWVIIGRILSYLISVAECNYQGHSTLYTLLVTQG